MKKFILTLAAALTLASCGSTQKEEVKVSADSALAAPVAPTVVLDSVVDTLLKPIEVTPTITGVVKAK